MLGYGLACESFSGINDKHVSSYFLEFLFNSFVSEKFSCMKIISSVYFFLKKELRISVLSSLLYLG